MNPEWRVSGHFLLSRGDSAARKHAQASVSDDDKYDQRHGRHLGRTFIRCAQHSRRRHALAGSSPLVDPAEGVRRRILAVGALREWELQNWIRLFHSLCQLEGCELLNEGV